MAEDIAGDDENEQAAPKYCFPTIDATADKLTRFALRLVLAGHVGIPREGEFDFLTEAEGVFAPPPPQKKKAGAKKASTRHPSSLLRKPLRRLR